MDDTICLLKECNAGCKSATNSMEQVKEYITDEKLNALINEYNKEHIKLGDEAHAMLNEYNADEKDPQTMASAFAWFTTEVKLMIKDDTSQIAKLMMDGCNMGIQSVSRYVNKYKAASKESIDLANRIIKKEEEFMDKLKDFLI